MVDEEILALAALRGDESVPLRVVEPLHCSSRHKKTPPLPLMNGRWEALGRPDTRSVKPKRSTGLVSWPEPALRRRCSEAGCVPGMATTMLRAAFTGPPGTRRPVMPPVY